jgi:predicted cupin superfamily sugar epimerase
MPITGDYYKKFLELKPHPEGGYYTVFYESKDEVKPLHPRYGKEGVYRPAGSSIYYFLQNKEFSAFHEVNSPEIWHYYTGNSAISLYEIGKTGQCTKHLLGNPSQTPGAIFQVLIEANQIFAAELCDPKSDSFALVGCTVSPGFTFQDFKLHKREELISRYPDHSDLIDRLTR